MSSADLTKRPSTAGDKSVTAPPKPARSLPPETNGLPRAPSQPVPRGRVLPLTGVNWAQCDRLLTAMGEHAQSAQAQINACHALRHLAKNPSNRKHVEEKGGLQLIVTALNSHRQNLNVQSAAYEVLAQLCVENEENSRKIREMGVLDIIIDGLTHIVDHQERANKEETSLYEIYHYLNLLPEGEQTMGDGTAAVAAAAASPDVPVLTATQDSAVRRVKRDKNAARSEDDDGEDEERLDKTRESLESSRNREARKKQREQKENGKDKGKDKKGKKGRDDASSVNSDEMSQSRGTRRSGRTRRNDDASEISESRDGEEEEETEEEKLAKQHLVQEEFSRAAVKIQTGALHAIGEMSGVSPSNRAYIVQKGGWQLIHRCVEQHTERTAFELQAAAFIAMAELARHPVADEAGYAAQQASLEVMLRILEAELANEEEEPAAALVSASCQFIGALACDVHNQSLVKRSGAMADVLQALKDGVADEGVARAACWAIGVFARNPNSQLYVKRRKALKRVQKALQLHPNIADVADVTLEMLQVYYPGTVYE